MRALAARRPGMEAGNAALGLRDTWPQMDGFWGTTTTSAADQLRLLADLTSPRSPLSAPARSYELSLMRHVRAGYYTEDRTTCLRFGHRREVRPGYWSGPVSRPAIAAQTDSSAAS